MASTYQLLYTTLCRALDQLMDIVSINAWKSLCRIRFFFPFTALVWVALSENLFGQKSNFGAKKEFSSLQCSFLDNCKWTFSYFVLMFANYVLFSFIELFDCQVKVRPAVSSYNKPDIILCSKQYYELIQSYNKTYE